MLPSRCGKVDENELRRLQAERQMELLKKQLFMRMLTKEARYRLANIRAANPELAAQVEIALIQLLQTGKLGKVDEQTLITLIKRLKGDVPKTRIMRR
jgi:programmed cell death protein 5